MTFINRRTTSEAQKSRRKRNKYDTPDRPGTHLAWSNTGKRTPGQKSAMQEALEAAQTAQRESAAAAMRKMAPKPADRA